jgi:undecaprenyl-diphosphatase
VKPAWFIGAAAVLGGLWWRRRKLEPTLLVGGLVVAIAMVVYGTGAVHFPDLDKTLEHVGTTLGPWTYLLVGVMAFAETGAFIGLLAPGETVILIGGVVAGQGEINLAGLIAIVWTCAVAGDLTSFWLGHRHGRDFLVRHGARFHITEARVEQVEGFFVRRGGQSILIGRFVGLVRAIAPFLAGSSGMPVRQFLAYDVIGAGAWGAAFAVLGFVFWQSLDKVLAWAKTGSLILAVVIVVAVGIVTALKWLRDADNRDRVDHAWQRVRAHPLVKPVVRTLEPLARWSRRPAAFLLERITPGNLGLELTALATLVTAGGFVFIGYLTTVHDGTFTPGDRRAAQWAVDVTAGWLTDAAKAITALGTSWVIVPLVIVSVALLARRRQIAEAAAIAVGCAVTFGLAQWTKAGIHRHRPPGALVATEGWSFPSGHASSGVLWLAVGVALWRLLSGTKSRSVAIIVGAVITVAIGLSRVYLRAHWWSDVAAGWGLGVAVYALCGAAALVAEHHRRAVTRSTARSPT